MGFPRSGLAVIRKECRRTPLHERSAACLERGAVVLAASKRDWLHVAQPGCGRAFCSAPGECGIRGLGRRTQKRPEHDVLPARHAGLRMVCPTPFGSTLCLGSGPVRICVNGKTSGHYLSLRSHALGYLAPAALSLRRELLRSIPFCPGIDGMADSGKNTAAFALCR